MMRRVFALVVVMAMTMGGVALGQDQAPATRPVEQGKEQVERIATFVSNDSVAVVRLDLPRIDAKAVEDWLKGFIEAAEPDPQVRRVQMDKLQKQAQAVQEWTSKMRQAGVSEVYAILNRQTLKAPGAGEAQEVLAATIVVPLKPGENPQAIQDLLLPKNQGQPGEAGRQPATAVIRDAVVLAPREWLNRLQQPAQGDVQATQRAMTAVEGSAIELAFVPSAQMRQAAAAMAEQGGGSLPQGVAPQDVKAIAQEIQWTAVGLDTPPQQALRVVVQASDPQAAQKMSATIDKLLNAARQNKAFVARVPDSERMLRMLTPTVVGDRLTVTLDSQQMDQLFKQDIATAIRKGRSEQPIHAGEMPQGQQDKPQREGQPPQR